MEQIGTTTAKNIFTDQAAWCDLPGSQCCLRDQSPINIDTASMEPKYWTGDLQFISVDGWEEGDYSNTGNTGEMEAKINKICDDKKTQTIF